MKKKLIVMIAIAAAALSGCSRTTENIPSKMYSSNVTPFGSYSSGIWVDPETGVNYIWFSGHSGRSYMSVRLKPDGTPFVTGGYTD